VISHGLPIYVALKPVDMRLGAERLGALVRERMRAEPRSRALFVLSAHNWSSLYCALRKTFQPVRAGVALRMVRTFR
jgi:hypothetical protein